MMTNRACEDLTFAHDGAALFADALEPDECMRLERILGDMQMPVAGVRLYNRPGLVEALNANSTVGKIAEALLGAVCRPVRAVLFDKAPGANWSLAWHQDRTIVVNERRETDGFGPWSVKQGLQHVEPPFEVLQDMATLRIHLDPTPLNNAPLLIAPGSHRLGRAPADRVAQIAERCGVVACVAQRGDIWAYSTSILHASEAARSPARRRVLQVDYAGTDLPNGLQWLGV